MKLLLVDRDSDLLGMLEHLLEMHGFVVSRAFTGERACREWEIQKPDIVLLDPTLKDRDGLLVCQQMRSRHDALVLVMTASKDINDEIRCFEAGADGYVRKPFLPAQLLAYIHALSRRICFPLERRPSSAVTVGPLRFDPWYNHVVVEGKMVHLTPTERKVLYFLAVHANATCTPHQIASSLWGESHDGDARLIKTHIHHLRQKIEPDPSHPTSLLTVVGEGYLFKHQRRGEKHSDAKK